MFKEGKTQQQVGITPNICHCTAINNLMAFNKLKPLYCDLDTHCLNTHNKLFIILRFYHGLSESKKSMHNIDFISHVQFDKLAIL